MWTSSSRRWRSDAHWSQTACGRPLPGIRRAAGRGVGRGRGSRAWVEGVGRGRGLPPLTCVTIRCDGVAACVESVCNIDARIRIYDLVMIAEPAPRAGPSRVGWTRRPRRSHYSSRDTRVSGQRQAAATVAGPVLHTLHVLTPQHFAAHRCCTGGEERQSPPSLPSTSLLHGSHVHEPPLEPYGTCVPASRGG